MAKKHIYWPRHFPRTATDGMSEVMPDDRIETKMSKGVHIRENGDSISKTIDFTLVFSRFQYAQFEPFWRDYGGWYIWMPYPDPTDPTIDPDKYYLFIAKKSEGTQIQKRAENQKYYVQFSMLYMFKAKPRDFNDQSDGN